MSLFLFYFDDGPLDDLGGTRSSLVLRAVPQIVRYRGAVLTRRVVAITDGVASESFRHASGTKGAAMVRDLALLIIERLLRSHSPRLMLHVDSGCDAVIDATDRVQLAILDVYVRVVRTEVDGHSGSQARVSGSSGFGRGTSEMSAAEGEVGTLGAVLAIVPYDTLVTFGAPSSPATDRSAGRRKKNK